MATIGGELRTWHAVTLDFAGPPLAERGGANPFVNFRLDVTFTHATTGEEIVVPGFFAADGDAAETGADGGAVWRVNFAPPLEGAWTYEASFRTGRAVAASADIDAGRSAGWFDGERGAIEIAATDKTGDDLRGKGALDYVGARYYRFAETGEWFLKSGTNSPENLLAYSGFDNTVPTHAFVPHERDWRPGDPTWNGGEGRGLIGAVNYLADQDVNAMYFLTLTVGGDGDDVSPWLRDTALRRYDVSKLAQWDIVFDHMTARGIMPHIVLQEQENDQLLGDTGISVERAVYYRELIARFAHHPALQWNLGEENSNTTAQRLAFADFIRALDPYDHPIVVHTFPNRQEAVYGPLLGDPDHDGASLQTADAHGQTIRWVDASAAAGRPWVVTLDELGSIQNGVPTDAVDPDKNAIRSDFLWGTLMAGGAGVEWYFGTKPPDGDITAEDFRTRDNMWRQTDHALDFFRDHLPFTRMAHDDGLTADPDDYVFAERGAVYAVYLPDGGEALLDLTGAAGRFSVTWFDPRHGGALQTGSVTEVEGGGVVALGIAPRQVWSDWTILVRAVDEAPLG